MLAEIGPGLLLAAGAVAAVTLGGGRERAGVAVLAVVLGAWMLMPDAPRGHPALWAMLAVDLGALAVLGKVAWKSPRSWPVWAMAAQAVAAAASLAFALQPDVGAETYLRGLALTRYGAGLALLIGACRRPMAHL